VTNAKVKLDRLHEVANERARSFRTAYAFFISVVLYTIVIVSTTHHQLLFRAGDVHTPILNVAVPVVGFFLVVPWVVILLHFGLLLKAIFLADTISQYTAALDKQSRPLDEKKHVLSLLYPIPLAHKIANVYWRGSMRNILNVSVLVTMIVLPPVFLLFAQVQFLPYQDELFTWLHRLAVVMDIGLLWWLWPRIAAPRMAWAEWCRGQKSKIAAPAAVTAFVSFFSVVFADLPGGTMSNLTTSLNFLRDSLEREYSLSNRVLVQEAPSPEILASHYRETCESRDGCDESVISVGSPFWCRHAKPLQLERRKFTNAALSKSTLCWATLREARLQGADLREAKLGQAVLAGAEFHGAQLAGADLHGADLRGAKLHRADLQGAKLHDARLAGAELHGAQLAGAKLHGADLLEAKLHGASLLGAEFHGANLRSAKLHGAALTMAQFHGADLTGAGLHWAILAGTEFHGADMTRAELHGAVLANAEFHGADMAGTELHGTVLMETKFHGANLTEAKLHFADLRWIDLSSKLKKGQLGETRQKIAKINSPNLRTWAWERIENMENKETSIEPESLRNSVLCSGDDISKLLEDSKFLQEVFVVDCQSGNKIQLARYYEMLGAYFVDLVCSGKSAYPAKDVYIAEAIKTRSKIHIVGERELLSWKKVLSIVKNEEDCIGRIRLQDRRGDTATAHRTNLPSITGSGRDSVQRSS